MNPIKQSDAATVGMMLNAYNSNLTSVLRITNIQQATGLTEKIVTMVESYLPPHFSFKIEWRYTPNT